MKIISTAERNTFYSKIICILQYFITVYTVGIQRMLWYNCTHMRRRRLQMKSTFSSIIICKQTIQDIVIGNINTYKQKKENMITVDLQKWYLNFSPHYRYTASVIRTMKVPIDWWKSNRLHGAITQETAILNILKADI